MAISKVEYSVAPLHNVSLPKTRDLISLGQYRIVRVIPNRYQENEYIPGDVTWAMHQHEKLKDWTDVLNEGYRILTKNSPTVVAYFFPEQGEFEEWMRNPGFAEVERIFAALQCGLMLMNRAYVSVEGNWMKGVSIKEGAIADICNGKEGFGKTPNVPMMFNPRFLGDDEPVLRLTRRDAVSLTKVVEQARRAQRTRLDTAIERLVSSISRSEVDRLVDLLVALEVLFGDEDRSALAYKIAFRCSTIVAAPGSEREEMFKLVKQAYDKRSRVLHGQARDLEWLGQNLDAVDSVVRRALTWALRFCWQNGVAPEGKDVDMLSFKATPAQL